MDTLSRTSLVLLSLIVALTAALLSGCVGARAHFSTFAPTFAPSSGTYATIGEVIDAGDKDLRGDIPSDFEPAAELRKQLAGKLSSAGLHSEQPAPNILVLTPTITDYDPGNALHRWISPGAGTTVLRVSCKVEQHGAEVGTVRIRRTVECCGLYSAGQWKGIFEDVADDLVDELKKKLRPGK